MEWIEFLDRIAIEHKLTTEQTATLIARFDRQNDDKNNIQISNTLNISEVLLKKRLGDIYKTFEPTCPDLKQKSRGKLEALRACLLQQYDRFQSQSLRAEPVGTPSNLPLSGVVKFVGREQDLKTVHENLQEATTVAISSVWGMGGVGKTELALQYAYGKLREEAYPGGVCWVNTRAQNVGIAILDFARTQLGLPEPPETLNTVPQQVEWVCRRWQGEPILVVLDDVVDYAAVKPYVQKLDARFRVLMTTRLQLGTAARRLELKVLTEAAALELLRVLVEDAERIDSQLEEAKTLCERLGYLPLGLELVGRYLARKRDLSLAQMLARLQAKSLAARALVKTEADMTAQLGVAAAFELSWAELPPEARVLCGLLSVFALAPIPWAFVEACLSGWDEEELEDCRDEELVERSLLARVGKERYELHQLIREFFAVKLEEELGEVAEALRQRFAVVLTEVAKTISQTVTLTDIVRVEEALPHLAVVAEGLTHLLEDEDAMWSFVGLARVAEARSFWQEAEQLQKTCLQMAETRFGSDHPHTATSLNNLAALYESMGRYNEAEPLYVRSLSIREQQLGADHPDTATSLNNLAALYRSMGRYNEAEPLYVRSLSITEQQLGADHPSTATSLNNLAELYRSMGRYNEAEPLRLRCLEIEKRTLGEEHPQFASSLNNLAGLYESMGRYTEAEPLYVRSLSIIEQQLGADHPHTATSLNNLAALYESMGRYNEAEPLLVRSLSIREQQLGADHPSTATSLNNLAALYESMGRYNEAEPLYVRTLAIWTQCLPENHPHIQTAWSNFCYLVQQAVENGKAGELSAHPATQAILKEMQN